MTLAAGESLFRALLESAPDAMVIINKAGVIELVNAQAERMFGYPRDELLGERIEILVSTLRQHHPGHRDTYFSGSRVREMTAGLESFGLRKNGEEFPVEISLSTLDTDEGLLVSSSIRDVTDRQRVERALLAQTVELERAAIAHVWAAALERERDRVEQYLDAARLAAIVTSSDDAIIGKTLDGIITSWNAGAERIFGYTPAEAVGQPMLMLFPPDRVDEESDMLALVARGESVHHFETVRVRKDGVCIDVSVTLSPVIDHDGHIVGASKIARDITERKYANDELRQSVRKLARAESEFRALFASNPLPMWIYDQTTLQFLEVNNAAVQSYGYSRDEFLAMTIQEIRPADDVQGLLTDLAQPRKRWQHAGSWRHRFKSGQIIDVDITSHQITFAGLSAALVVAQDITERKHAEEEILQRAQLSALGAAVGLSLSATDTLTQALQQCAEAIVTHLGAAFARIWTLNERESVLELQASAGLYTHLNGPHGSVPVGEFKIGRIARDRKPHLTNSVVSDPEVSDQEWARREGMVAFAGHPLIVGDRVVGVMALFSRHALPESVISALASVADHIALGIDRNRGIEALRNTEERMRFALRNADVGIWDMDYATGVLRWSSIIEAHYGLKPGTFVGTFEAFIERVHPDDRASLLETLAKAMKSGSDFSLQNRSIWPDGTIRWLSGTGRVLLGEHGEPTRAVGISLDVTERHTLEEQYQQAQKMEAVGRLAGGVAHDFNNLLTVILGYCELLLSDFKPGDPHQADIAEIQKAGARAGALTRQLLAFSRKQIITPTLLDLNLIATDLRAMLGRLIGEDVKVVLALHPDLAPVKADRGQVEQVVMNLAVNARDAMPKGGTLTIETANVELDEHYARTHRNVKPGAYVALTMTDTGTGMTPDVQARLFEPFFTTKEIGKGTGLGMATVYGIVTGSGGSVGVYSEIGKGTSFKVYFPRAEAADVIVEGPLPVPLVRAGTQTVLVVEDEEGLRELARKLLVRQGYTVLIAANADEAVRLFDANPSIDVLLTDVVMPGASGPELTRQLVEQRPALRVIYMSGYTEEAIVQHGVLKPGIVFLNKPFNSETLGAKIREVLER